MLAKTFSYFLTAGLGEFFEEESFSASNVQLGVLSGFVVLENLRCKKSLFDRSGLPLQLLHGSIGRLELRIPWSNIWHEQVTVAVDRLLFVLASRYDYDDKDDKRRQMDAMKAAQLAAFELISNASSQTAATSSSSWGLFRGSYITQYARKLLKAVIDNIHISLREVHVRYEDRTSCTDDYCCGVTLESLSLTSLTAFDKSASFKDSSFSGDGGSVFKDFQMYQLSVYCNPLAASDAVSACVGDMSHHAACVMLSRTIARRGYSFHEAPKHNFILKPLNASTHLRLLVDPTARTVSMEIHMSMAAIHMALSSKQLQCMITTANTMTAFMVMNTYRYLRPDCSVSEDRCAWWRYAGAAVLAQISASVKKEMTKQRLVARRRDRMVYCELWKSKMVHVGKRRGRSRTMSEGSVSEMYDQMAALFDSLIAKYNSRKALRDRRIRDRSFFSKGQLVQLMPYADWTPLSRALLSAIERRRSVEDIAFFRSQADLQLSQEGFQPSSSRSIVSRLSLGLFTSDEYDETEDEQKLLEALSQATAQHASMQQSQLKDAYKLKIEFRHVIEEVTMSLSLSGDRIMEQSPFFIANLYGLSTSVTCQSGEEGSFPVQAASRIEGFEVLEGVSPIDQDSDDVFSGLRRYVPICWVHTEPIPNGDNDALSISSSFDMPAGDPLHLSRYSSPAPPTHGRNNGKAQAHDHTTPFIAVNVFFDAGGEVAPHVDIAVAVQGTDLWIHENSTWIEKMALFTAPTSTQRKISDYRKLKIVPDRPMNVKPAINQIVKQMTTNTLAGISLDLTIVSPRILLSVSLAEDMDETKSDALSMFTDFSQKINGMCSANVLVVSLGTISVKTDKNVRMIRDRAILSEFREELGRSFDAVSPPPRGDEVREARLASAVSENSLFRLSNSVLRPPLPAAKSERELFVQSPGSLYSPTVGKSRYFFPPSPRSVEASTFGDIIRICISDVSIHVTNNVPTERWKQLSINTLAEDGALLRNFSSSIEYQNVLMNNGIEMKGVCPCRVFVDTSKIELSLSLSKLDTILRISGGLMKARLPARLQTTPQNMCVDTDLDISEDDRSYFDAIADTKSNATRRSRYRKAVVDPDTTLNDDDFLSAHGESDDDVCSVESLAMAHEAAALRLTLEELEKRKSNILDDMLTSYGGIDDDEEKDYESEDYIRRKETELKECESELQRVKVAYVEVMMKLDIERYASQEASVGDHNDEESLSSRGSSKRQQRIRDDELVESTARPIHNVESTDFALGNCTSTDLLVAFSLNLGDVSVAISFGDNEAGYVRFELIGVSVRLIHTDIEASIKCLLRECSLAYESFSPRGTFVIPIVTTEQSYDAVNITNLFQAYYNVRFQEYCNTHHVNAACARNPSINFAPLLAVELMQFGSAVTDLCNQHLPEANSSNTSLFLADSFDDAVLPNKISLPQFEVSFVMSELSLSLLNMSNTSILNCVSNRVVFTVDSDREFISSAFSVGDIRVLTSITDSESVNLIRSVGNGSPFLSVSFKFFPPPDASSLCAVEVGIELSRLDIFPNAIALGRIIRNAFDVIRVFPETTLRSENNSRMSTSDGVNLMSAAQSLLRRIEISFKFSCNGVGLLISAGEQRCAIDTGGLDIMLCTRSSGCIDASVSLSGTNIRLDGESSYDVLEAFDSSFQVFATFNPDAVSEHHATLDSATAPVPLKPSAACGTYVSTACTVSPIHFTISDKLNSFIFDCISAIDAHIVPHIHVAPSVVFPTISSSESSVNATSLSFMCPLDIFMSVTLRELCVFVSLTDTSQLPRECMVHVAVEEISDNSPTRLVPVFGLSLQGCEALAKITSSKFSMSCDACFEQNIQTVSVLYFGTSVTGIKRIVTSQAASSVHLWVGLAQRRAKVKCLVDGVQCAICPEIALAIIAVVALSAAVWLPEKEQSPDDTDGSDESSPPSKWERSEVFALRRRLDISPQVDTSLQTLSGVHSGNRRILLSDVSFMLPGGLSSIGIEVEVVDAGVWVGGTDTTSTLHCGFSCKGQLNIEAVSSDFFARGIGVEHDLCTFTANVFSLQMLQSPLLPLIFRQDIFALPSSLPQLGLSRSSNVSIFPEVERRSTPHKYYVKPVSVGLRYVMNISVMENGCFELQQQPEITVDELQVHMKTDYRPIQRTVSEYAHALDRLFELMQSCETHDVSTDSVIDTFPSMSVEPIHTSLVTVFDVLQESANISDMQVEIFLAGAEVVLIDDTCQFDTALAKLVLLPAKITVASHRKVRQVCFEGVWRRHVNHLPLRINISGGLEVLYRNCRLLAWEPVLEQNLFTVDIAQPAVETTCTLYWNCDMSVFPCDLAITVIDTTGDVDTNASPHSSVSVHFSRDININVTMRLLECIGLIFQSYNRLAGDKSRRTSQAIFKNDTGFPLVFRLKMTDVLRRVPSGDECVLLEDEMMLELTAVPYLSVWALTSEEDTPFSVEDSLYLRTDHESYVLNLGASRYHPTIVAACEVVHGQLRMHVRSTFLLRNTLRLPIHVIVVSGSAQSQHGRKVLWEAVISPSDDVYVPAQFCCQSSNRILVQPLLGDRSSSSAGYVQYVEYAEMDIPVLPGLSSTSSHALCRTGVLAGTTQSRNTSLWRRRSKSDWNHIKLDIRSCSDKLDVPENSSVQYSQWLHCAYLPAGQSYLLHKSNEFSAERSRMLAGGHGDNEGVNVVSHVKSFGKTSHRSGLTQQCQAPYMLREIVFSPPLLLTNSLSCDVDVVCSRSRIFASKRRGHRIVEVESTIAAGGHLLSLASGETVEALDYHPVEEFSFCLLLKFASQNLEVWSEVVKVRGCEPSEQFSVKLCAPVLHPNNSTINICCDIDEACGQRRITISVPYWVVNASTTDIEFQHATDEDYLSLLSPNCINGADALAPGQTIITKTSMEPALSLQQSITEVRRIAAPDPEIYSDWKSKASVTMCGYTDDLYSTCVLRFRLSTSQWSRKIKVAECSGDVLSITAYESGKKKKYMYCLHTKRLDSVFNSTCAIMIADYHQLTNLITESIEIRLTGDETILKVGHGSTVSMNWCVGAGTTLKFRVAADGWLWSGNLSADNVGIRTIRTTNPMTQAIMIIEVQVTKVNGVMQTILRAAQAHAPFRIENYSSATVKMFQVNASVHTVLPPYHGCVYAWDEPLLQPLMTLEGRYHDDEYEWHTVGLFSFDKCDVTELNFFMVVAVQCDDDVGVIRIMDKSANLSYRYIAGNPSVPQSNPIPETRILVTVPHICVSLIDATPCELIVSQISSITVDVVQSTERLCVTAACDFIQIDDQLDAGIDSSPILQILPQSISGYQNKHSLSFHLSQDFRNKNANVYSMVQMASMRIIVSVQEALLRRVIAMFSKLPPELSEGFTRHIQHADISNASVAAAISVCQCLDSTYKAPNDIVCHAVYALRHLILPAIELTLTLCPCASYISSDYGTPSIFRNLLAAADTIIRKFITGVVKIERVPLRLNMIELESVVGRDEDVGARILQEYQLQVMNRIIRRILSPETLLYSVVDTAAFTVLSAVSNFSALLQESIRSGVMPVAMRAPLESANDNQIGPFLGDTVLRGVLGAAIEPARGFYHGGLFGFTAGCARAGVGLGALPLYGVAGIVHRSAAYLTSAIYPSVPPSPLSRVHAPRVFMNCDVPLRPREQESTESGEVVITLTQEHTYLLFDAVGMQLLRNDPITAQRECVWSCKYSNVLLAEFRDVSLSSDRVSSTDLLLRRLCEDSSSTDVHHVRNNTPSLAVSYSVAGDERVHMIEVTPNHKKDCNNIIRVLRQRAMSCATFNLPPQISE